MIAVDTSALMAIVLGEPEGEACMIAIEEAEQLLISAGTGAGALIVEEAGGSVTRWDGSPYQSRALGLVASNGGIHAAMLGVIAGFGARRARQRTE